MKTTMKKKRTTRQHMHEGGDRSIIWSVNVLGVREVDCNTANDCRAKFTNIRPITQT